MFSFSSSGAAKPKPEDTLKDKVKQWTTELRGQMRDMDRQIRHLERDEEKIKREIKLMAKRGEMSVVKMAAKNIIVIRKSEERLLITKAQLNSVMMTLQTDLALHKVAGSMAKSTAIMKSMSQLLKVPELNATMRKMGQEMAHAGIVEEMMGDAMDAAEPAGLDEEADELTEEVIYELTGGLLGKAGVASGALPTGTKAGAGTTVAPARRAVLEGDHDGDVAALRDHLDKM